MSPLSMMAQLAIRIKLHRLFTGTYRRSLVTAACWKTEKGLTSLLCGGMGLILFTTCLQLRAVFFDTGTLALNQPPQLLVTHTSAPQAMPEIVLKRYGDNSVFQLTKQHAPEIIPAKQHAEPDKQEHAVQVPLRNIRQWQLQIYRPPISDAFMLGTIAHAQKQLQSGQVGLARQAFLAVLTQDSHCVEAIEGMLQVSRQLGDREGEEAYLERLRQEIPDYLDEKVSSNDVSSVNNQD